MAIPEGRGPDAQAAPRGILSDSLLSRADFSWVRLHPSDPGSAGPSSCPTQEASHSVRSLTHRAQLGRGLAWSAGRPQGPWPLSPVTPATDQLGEFRAPGRVNLVWGAEGTAMAQCGESHAGWEINTKRLKQSWAALLPFGWNGEEVLAGVEGGR